MASPLTSEDNMKAEPSRALFKLVCSSHTSYHASYKG